jgi:MFS family permease
MLFLVDFVAFALAFSFVSVFSVMPAFVRELTDSEPIVGLIGTVHAAGWLLPQLGVAAALAGRPSIKPIMLVATTVGRSLFFVQALAIWGGLAFHPTPMLVVFFACLSIYTLLDGVATVAWFDIMARAIPLAGRGRLMGIGSFLSGLFGIGAGVLVTRILESSSLAFPNNYALLFAIAGAVHIPAVIALSQLKEPEADTVAGETDQSSIGKMLGHLKRVWSEDASFRRLMGARWLLRTMDLSYGFYILHAIDVIGLSEGFTGRYVSAERIGGLLGSLGLTWLNERFGPRTAIWAGSVSAIASPLLAFILHFVKGVPPMMYLAVPFCFGITNSSWLLGLFNYLLEMAPDGQRPIYIGLSNTLAGLLVPAPFLGGFILRLTSYPVLFSISAIGATAGLLLSLRLKRVSQEA